MTTKIELRRMTFWRLSWRGTPRDPGWEYFYRRFDTDSSVGERGMERRFKRYDQLRHSI